jgi:hypothetical protein
MLLDGPYTNPSTSLVLHLTSEYLMHTFTTLSFIGCMNTPSKSSRFCDIHVQTATSLRNDAHLMNDGKTTSSATQDFHTEIDDVLPIRVTNDKLTRNGHFNEVQSHFFKSIKIMKHTIKLHPKTMHGF